jgi:hypothetical protein
MDAFRQDKLSYEIELNRDDHLYSSFALGTSQYILNFIERIKCTMSNETNNAYLVLIVFCNLQIYINNRDQYFFSQSLVSFSVCLH